MITLTGSPLSTSHIYKFRCAGKFPMMYMTSEGRAMKEAYQWQITAQHKEKITALDITMEVNFYFPDKHRRDIDNYSKILLDAMSGIVYVDDTQIRCLIATKHLDRENPRIEINIIPWINIPEEPGAPKVKGRKNNDKNHI